MTLNDIYAAQIESHYFFYLVSGAYVTCLCMTMYICAKIVAQALATQKVVVHVPVYDATVAYNHWLNRSVTQKSANSCVN